MRTDIKISWASSVTQLPIDTWRDLLSEYSLFQSASWLRAIETGSAGTARYCVASVDDHVAGVLPVYPPIGRVDSLYRPELHFPRLDQAIPGAVCKGVLLAGRSGYRTDFLLADQPRRGEVLAALLRDAVRAEPYGFVLFATTTAHDSMTASGLSAVSQLAFAADANLPVAGPTFADYLASLPSRRRNRIRHEIRAFQDAGLRIDTIHEAAELDGSVDHLADMFCQLQRKHDLAVSRADMKSEIIRQLTYMGNRAVYFVCRAGNKMTGFATAYIGDDRWLYLRMGGFDYGKLLSAYEYFNTVIYQPLLFCAENGYAGLRLGAGSHEAKALRGAKLSPLLHIAIPGLATAPSSRQRAASWWWRKEIRRLPGAFDPDQWEPWLSAT